MAYASAPALVDDEGEAFARAVFGRFLRQATICRDVDDAIEHMHIVNDNSRTFDIRLGGDARIPVGSQLILALAAKKKELLALCEARLRHPRHTPAGSAATTPAANPPSTQRHQPTIAAATAPMSTGAATVPPIIPIPGHQSPQQHKPVAGSGANATTTSPWTVKAPTQSFVFPPPEALAATASPTFASAAPGGGGDGASGEGSAVVAAVLVPAALSSSVGEAVEVVVPRGGVVGGTAVAQQQLRRQQQQGQVPKLGADAVDSGVEAEHQKSPPVDVAQSAPPVASINPDTQTLRPAGQPPPRSGTSPSTQEPRDTRGPTTVFVRKIDTKISREDVLEHFQAFGDVVAISMNSSRGFAFVDFPSHDCVLRAVRAPQHVVRHKTLQVEMKKERRQGGEVRREGSSSQSGPSRAGPFGRP